MAQDKKDFTANAASVFVDKMMTPEAALAAARKPEPDARRYYTNKAKTEIKVTFMIDNDIDRKLRYIAYAERWKQKQIINEALANYIADYERRSGKIGG